MGCYLATSDAQTAEHVGAAPPRFSVHLLVRNRSTSFLIRFAAIDRLDHAEVVLHVIERAVIGKACEPCPWLS
jgi:hypothetical protein